MRTFFSLLHVSHLHGSQPYRTTAEFEPTPQSKSLRIYVSLSILLMGLIGRGGAEKRPINVNYSSLCQASL